MGNYLCEPDYDSPPDQLNSSQKGSHKNSLNTNSGNYEPQQNLFVFDELRIDSRIESGNLMHADHSGPGHYTLWIAPDNFKTQFESNQRIWFYYKVDNINMGNQTTKKITFKIANMSRTELANYKNGMVPVCCGPSTNNRWQHIPSPLKSFKPLKECLEFEFEYEFTIEDSNQGFFFAFTFPYTYSECNNLMNYLEQTLGNDPDVFFHRQVVAHSLEGRRIDLLTITGSDPSMHEANAEYEPMIQNLFPEAGYRPPKFRSKKYILISCRVHPCEAPANFMLQGFLLALANKNDAVTQALLQKFVFVVIPMLNPDGVSKGNYRCDSKGRDLNRVYHKAVSNPKEFPGPFAVMQVGKSLADGRLAMYLDLHAHSNKDSGFIFATYSTSLEERAEIRLFARMFDMYSKNFDFTSCGFGLLADPNEKNPNKMGAAKSEISKYCNIFHSYTLECGYNRRTKDPERYTNNPGKDMRRKVCARVESGDFCEIGESLRHAILETLDEHPCSIVPNTWYKNVNYTRQRIREQLQKEVPTESKNDQEDDG